jgi:hypothetical protein
VGDIVEPLEPTGGCDTQQGGPRCLKLGVHFGARTALMGTSREVQPCHRDVEGPAVGLKGFARLGESLSSQVDLAIL